MKKTIALGVVFLLFMLSFTSISGNQINIQIVKNSSRGNILYVGGSGVGNYTKIQDAIDNASDSDTVYVYDDSSPYNEENILIDKSINLIGENRETTVIRHITIKRSRVNVSGFTLERGGIYADYKLIDIIISDNHIINDTTGMGFYADNSSIISNTFKNCIDSIFVEGYNNRISNNIFTYNSTMGYAENGIYCYGRKIFITNNTFINHNNDADIGIRLENTLDNIIENNEFSGYYFSAIWTYEARNNLISNNTFINNNCGIIIGILSNSNRVINNNFINNNIDADVLLHYICNNIVDGNYWDDWIGLKYPLLSFLPYFSISFFGSFIDWHPAKQPYNYTTIQGCGIR